MTNQQNLRRGRTRWQPHRGVSKIVKGRLLSPTDFWKYIENFISAYARPRQQ